MKRHTYIAFGTGFALVLMLMLFNVGWCVATFRQMSSLRSERVHHVIDDDQSLGITRTSHLTAESTREVERQRADSRDSIPDKAERTHDAELPELSGLTWLASAIAESLEIARLAKELSARQGAAERPFLLGSALLIVVISVLCATTIGHIRSRGRLQTSMALQLDRWRITLASIGDGVIVTDRTGRVTFMNHMAEKMCGWATREALGRPLPEVFHIQHERTRELAENPVSKVLREGVTVSIPSDLVLMSRQGSVLPIHDSASPIRNRSNSIDGVVLVFHDDTARRHHERELLLASRRKDEFLAMLAHELRNPLAAVRAALDVITFAKNDDQRTWSRDVIERQVEHLTHLIEDLLDVSRIACDTMQLSRQQVDASAVAHRAIESVRHLTENRGHSVSVSIAKSPLIVNVDPVRLEQILVNLLTNANKYTEKGGSIGLTVAPDGDTLRFDVVDNGMGITSDLMPHIFDMFHQGKRSLARTEGGLGLGLPIVRKLTESFGGTVEAFSEGKSLGSRFTVRIPMAPDPLISSLVTPNADAEPEKSPLRVLIVEDNRDLALGLASTLELQGHRVDVTHDGPSGLDAALTRKPDVVLLDIGLPGLDGYQVARRLRAHGDTKPARIIAISGYGQESDRQRSIEAGMSHHLTKPIDVQLLNRLLVAN
jgi:PAS domain S-box-containing protein